MAVTWAISHTKGGVGKSTVAINLAVAASRSGRRVLLVDADTQGSAATWAALRGEIPGIETVAVCSTTLHEDLPAMARLADLVIIDVGGRDSFVSRSAIAAADLVVIPALASQIDLYTASDVVEVVKEARTRKPALKAVFVLNQLLAGTRLGKEVSGVITGYGQDVSLCNVSLSQRTSYRMAYGYGLGVQELKGREKDNRASAEVSALFDALTKIAGGVKHAKTRKA